MRRVKHLVIIGILAIIFTGGFYLLQGVYQDHVKAKQYAQIELQEGYQDSDEFDELAKKMTEDEVGFVFWNEKKNVTITNQEFGRSETVDAIKVKGNTGCLYPNSNGLSLEDEGDCLIDKTTALKLFGSVNIIGQEIRYEEQSYVVKGILQDEKQVFVYEPIKGNETNAGDFYEHVTLKVPEGEQAENVIRKVKNLYGIQ